MVSENWFGVGEEVREISGNFSIPVSGSPEVVVST